MLNLLTNQSDDDHDQADAPTAPTTVPTVRNNATGSFDFDAMDSMKKKNTNAITIRNTPAMTTRQFLRRIVASSDRRHEMVATQRSIRCRGAMVLQTKRITLFGQRGMRRTGN
jgi:hypothetical protein